jgi:signal transduction histidine kinase
MPAGQKDRSVRLNQALGRNLEVAQAEMSKTRPKRFLLAGVALTAALLAAGVSWFHWRRVDSVVPTHFYELTPARMDEWKQVGGDWTIANGVVSNSSQARGSKLLTGSSAWGNYTVSSDVEFTGDNADMGVVIRTSDERKEGSDTYNGYYVGLRTLNETMVIGRANYVWMEAPPVHVPGGVHRNVWYRLRVTAYGCNMAATVQNLTTLQQAWIAFKDSSCFKTGHIGLRSMSSGGMWRNVSITSSSWNDYLELERHAASVEHLQVLPDEPWWTPWHAAMLFGGTLALALLAQLAYFRMQKWKTYTITHERERLAHDIHDTMAQSFAGVGYQIQGIRRRVVRGDRLDPTYLADQLRVAYQLVRNCHEEASRTIEMLGSGSPAIQVNLLGVLEQAARNITGDQIRIWTELNGNPPLLNLRLADALLHIGREAIVNAVSHSDPTLLTIRMSHERGSVELSVEDNGRGFDSTPEAAGFGIHGMKKRARDVGAVFQILSTPGHGTRVCVTARLHNETLLRRIFAKAEYRSRESSADDSAG